MPAGSFAALSKLFIINSQDYKVQHLNASYCLWVPQRPKGASMFILQVGGSQPQAPLWTHKRDRAPARSPPAPPPPHGSQPGCCKENWHPPMLKFTHMVGGAHLNEGNIWFRKNKPDVDLESEQNHRWPDEHGPTGDGWSLMLSKSLFLRDEVSALVKNRAAPPRKKQSSPSNTCSQERKEESTCVTKKNKTSKKNWQKYTEKR